MARRARDGARSTRREAMTRGGENFDASNAPRAGSIGAVSSARGGWDGWGTRASANARALALRSFEDVSERARESEALVPLDKAFGCAWLDEMALVCTKDHRLFEVELDRRRGRRPTFREVTLGRSDALEPPVMSGLERRGLFDWFVGRSGRRELAETTRRQTGGAHAVIVSLTGEHVLCSGGPDHSIVQFARDEETNLLVPRISLRGHEDVVFGLDFVDRDTLASCSRDGSVKIWQLPHAFARGSYESAHPIASVVPVGGCEPQLARVRGVKTVDRLPSKQLASVTSSGMVHQFDAETLGLVGAYTCRGYIETSCMCTNGSIVAVGSRTHVGLVDFRQKRLYASVALPFGDCNSVRSLSFTPSSTAQTMLTIGGGRGNIYFYDERTRKYLMNEFGLHHQLENNKSCVRLSESFIFDSEWAQEYLLPAILCHQWDPTGTRLLVAGGPLQAVLQGFYAAVWS